MKISTFNLWLHDHLPSPKRFFAQSWPHLKRNTGEIVKHMFTRNRAKCKYRVTDNAVFYFSRVYNSFQRDPQNLIVTLDASKFTEKKQQRLHIGNLRAFRPHITLYNELRLVVRDKQIFYNRSMPPHYPRYPPDTTAFLYYFTSSERPRIAGELRLRVASNDDHTSFESGFDLLRSNGRPWSRSLYSVSKYYTTLYEKLREDGLVSDDMTAVLSTLPPRVCKGQHLYTLNDTFFLDFSRKKQALSVITEQGMGNMQLTGLFQESHLQKSFYTGAYTNNHLSIDDS